MAASEEILSIRVPAGTKDQLRAASGQPASVITRYMIMGYLQRAKLQQTEAMSKLSQQAAAGMSEGAKAADDGVQAND